MKVRAVFDPVDFTSRPFAPAPDFAHETVAHLVNATLLVPAHQMIRQPDSASINGVLAEEISLLCQRLQSHRSDLCKGLFAQRTIAQGLGAEFADTVSGLAEINR